MQGALAVVDTYWGKENIYQPIINSTGFLLISKATLLSLYNIGDERTIDCGACFQEVEGRSVSVEILRDHALARGIYRDAFLASMALSFAKIVETVFWAVIGGLAYVFGHKELINLSKRAFVQLIINWVSFGLAIVGMIRPLWAVQLYCIGLREILKLDGEAIKTYLASCVNSQDIKRRILGGARTVGGESLPLETCIGGGYEALTQAFREE